MQKSKVVLTGGHAGSTAYALVERIRRDKSLNWDLLWIGSKKAVEGTSFTTYEHKVLDSVGVTFYSLTTGKLQTKFTKHTIPLLLKIPLGLIQAYLLLLRIKPNLIISFGGYASVPVVIAGWLLGVPVVIHEQTSVAGRANQVNARFAKKILLARESSLGYFENSKCTVIGNPISLEVSRVKIKTKINPVPVLFITGGSRGSVIINNMIMNISEKLLDSYKLIHLTGELGYKKILKHKESLSAEAQKKYRVYPFLGPSQYDKAIEDADIVIARAGANTVSELVMVKKPCVLIPLSIANKNEQFENAKFASRFGIATVIEEKDLSEYIILKTIDTLVNNYSKILKSTYNKKSPDAGAAERFLEEIKVLV